LSDIAVSSLKEGTDGQLITWGTNAEPTTVATGDADQILTSNGVGTAPTFQDAGGGGATYYDVNPATPQAVGSYNVWWDWDISALVPADAIAVEIYVYTTNAGNTVVVGGRASGSGVDKRWTIPAKAAGGTTFTVPANANQEVEIRDDNAAKNARFQVLGYWA